MGMTSRIFVGLGRLLLSLRYRIRVTGLDEVTARGTEGILFLPNHPALIDPVIVAGALHARFHPASLADRDRISGRIVGPIARAFGARPMPDPARHGEVCRAEVEQVIQACGDDLARGGNLLLYPAGHLARARYEDLGGNSAVETLLARAPRARVVMVRTRGLWGSSFSRASGASPDFMAVALRRCLDVLLSLIVLCPLREVNVEFREAEDFPRDSREAMNRKLEEFFNEDAPAALHVPHTPWEPGGRRELPDPPETRFAGDPTAISGPLRTQVLAHLAEVSGRTTLADEDLLARDLGMDSLMRLDLTLWIEQEFGHHVGDPDALATVGDVLLAASGRGVDSGRVPLRPVPSAWFRPMGLPVAVPPGETLTEVFLRQAARDPARAVLADQVSGVRTYRDLVTAILALRPTLAAIEGPYVGIMLPASLGAATLFMAALFAGKTPVMVNWTTGPRNMVHGLDLLGVRRVLTSAKVVSRMESQGLDLSLLRDRLLPMEEVGASMGKGRKIWALVRAWTSWRSLRTAKVPATAAVLFTSGSESLPKAVPMTHGNLLANVRDVVAEYPFLDGARFIGILPPFHSFGLTGTVVLPLCCGFQVVYYPVPTDGAILARHVEAYGVTALVGTPTFLAGIIRAATDDQIESLRHVISGAEKCPDSLFATIARRWPHMRVMEGYGITECSPVVSANREDRFCRGTIGWPMPSVRHAVVDPDSLERLPHGSLGMLLVRGPSIFPGYLGEGVQQPFVTFEGESWYRTGDLVRDEDGCLVFCGRLKRFAKTGGEMVSLPAVEEVLNASFALASDEEPVLAVEARETEAGAELTLFSVRDIPREQANTAIRQAGLSPIHNIRAVVRLERVPLLGTGKIDYRALKGLLEAAASR
jgi:acyl-CoA synthetase (AMP-forming)/AMP-acid ligase II/1-acyl-sn-glycerol-3-phosphate acyltransferase